MKKKSAAQSFSSVQFSFQFKVFILLQGLFLEPPSFPFPLSLLFFFSLFLLLLWHTTRVVPQQNRSRVLGLKCIMDETTRPIVVYLKDTYVSVSAPATHTHSHSLKRGTGCVLHLPPATCSNNTKRTLKRNEARLRFPLLSLLSLSICFFFHTR